MSANNSPTLFTDDKLEKDYFSDEEIAFASKTFPRKDRIHALLARLAAAEKVCGYVEFYWPKGEAKLEADLLKWRKAAGK